MHRMEFYQDDENICPLLLLLKDEKWKGCHLLPGTMKICNAHVCFKVERWIRFINVYMCAFNKTKRFVVVIHNLI